ncbi:MAG: carboxymuconolactone decarboxylase family protein [Candidatus Riflebacteria bacterium]|nr:carboxymuconolactone decarboxylase family protein [Candidatus Riflebacteria bacterium]
MANIKKTKVSAPKAPARSAKKVLTPLDNAVLGDQELCAGLRALNADFGDLCIRASGEAYAKPLIPQKTKVMITLVVDIVEQIHGKPFENHLAMAVKQGITQAEMEELLLFMTIYAGFNKAGTYYMPVKEFFTNLKAKPAAKAKTSTKKSK